MIVYLVYRLEEVDSFCNWDDKKEWKLVEIFSKLSDAEEYVGNNNELYNIETWLIK